MQPLKNATTVSGTSMDSKVPRRITRTPALAPWLAATRRFVILSPHPDDAVWSLGGAIPLWQEHAEVLVVSIFDGDAPSTALPYRSFEQHRWRGLDAPALRRMEDQLALALLNCPLLGLGHCDAAMRQDRSGAFECGHPDALFQGPDYITWPEAPLAMQAQLRQLLQPGDRLVAPLALGRHIDHCIAHKLARDASAPVSYYAEFPYALGRQASLASHCESLGLPLRAEEIRCDWPRWLAAAARYRSQVLRMFGGHTRLSAQLAAYACADGARASCRIWSAR